MFRKASVAAGRQDAGPVEAARSVGRLQAAVLAARRAAGRCVRLRCQLRPQPCSGLRAALGQVIGAPEEGKGDGGGQTAAAPTGARSRAVPRVGAQRGAAVAKRKEGRGDRTPMRCVLWAGAAPRTGSPAGP